MSKLERQIAELHVRADRLLGKKQPQSFKYATADEIEAAALEKSREIAARDKTTVSAASEKLKVEAPELYAAYAALRR